MKQVSVFWFRRDLRTYDNVGLSKITKFEKNILPIFIFDKNITEVLENNDARISFIYDSIKKLNITLSKFESSIKIYVGTPIKVWQSIVKEFNIKSVYANEDYEPYAIKRDSDINKFLTNNNIPFKLYKDSVIFHKNDILKEDKKPYKIYTHYKKKWLSLFDNNIKIFTTNNNAFLKQKFEFPTLEQIGFKKSSIKVLPIKNIDLTTYKENRNYPHKIHTSYTSVHLRFGTIGIRELIKKFNLKNNSTYLEELIWREFFFSIIWHFPKAEKNCFKEKYETLEWNKSEKDFTSWKNGNTGYPIVDAGMKELNKTGYMHNRVRMIVASFLVKHLLIDWRMGERYFAKKLLDYDLAQNNGNWQWVAGTGCDSAPYFRIFNPIEQQKKYDKDFLYIKKWLPNFNPNNYITPIIEHKFARNRTLNIYKKVNL